MKRAIFLICLCFAVLGVRSQDSLTIAGGGNIYNLPSTAFFNDQIPCNLYVKNIGSTVFTDTVYFTTMVDSTPFDSSVILYVAQNDFIAITILPGDSFLINITELITPSAYRAGGNIVVIWPSCNSAWFNNTTLLHYIDILGYAGMNDPDQEEVKLYPNPVMDVVNVYYHPTGPMPERIIFRDICGRMLMTAEFENGEARIDGLPPGFYTAEVVFRHGPSSFVRIVKARR